MKAVVPVLEAWLQRKHGRLSFRITQILTGHGCFGAFLFRIGKERAASCWFCQADIETVNHTVFECPKWQKGQAQLVRRIGPDVTLSTLVREILQDDHHWAAFQQFADAVLKAKEAAERIQKRTE